MVKYVEEKMKSFKIYLSEARPKGQKRFQRDTAKLETRLDKLYAAGGSQKKIDRAEMRLARKTNEGEYGIDDQMLPTSKSTDTHLSIEEHPRAQSLEELMREKARLLYTGRIADDNKTKLIFNHQMVGSEIRSAMNDVLHMPHHIQPGVSDEELGQEAHKILIAHNKLLKRIQTKRKYK